MRRLIYLLFCLAGVAPAMAVETDPAVAFQGRLGPAPKYTPTDKDYDSELSKAAGAGLVIDTGNRAAFANGGGAMMLHADFARRTWSEAACAPLVEDGAEVAALRDRLLARAGALGHRRSPDPALTLLVEALRHRQ